MKTLYSLVVVGILLLMWSSCKKEEALSSTENPRTTSTNNTGCDTISTDTTHLTLNLPSPQDSVACACNNDPNPMGAHFTLPNNSLTLQVGGTSLLEWRWVIKSEVVHTGQGAVGVTKYCDFDPTVIHVDSIGTITGLSLGQTTIQVCQYNGRATIAVNVVP